MKCKRESDGRAIDHHSLEVMRMQLIKAVKSGQTVSDVAAAFGINIRTAFRWLSDYANGGQQALQAKPIPGRPPKLSPDQMRWIVQTVRDNSPLQFKFPFGLWTLNLIRELIKRELNTSMSIAAVHRVMRMLGFTPQKPLYRAFQQDAVLVQKWQTEDFPAIRAEAKAAGATIFFADEAGMRSDYHTGTTWAQQGKTPIVSATGSRFSLNMISAVSARGDFRFMLHEGTVNAEVFIEFLSRLMQGAERPIFLVVDGHRIHRAKLVQRFVELQHGKLKLFYLPPYSPQLNPDEQVWAHVKRDVSRAIVKDQADMKSLILGALRRIQKLPALVSSFFRHPDCQYAGI